MIISIAETIFKVTNAVDNIKDFLKDFVCQGDFEKEIILPFNNNLSLQENFDKQRSVLSKQVTTFLFSKNIIRVHCSAIKYKNNAYLFLAPSGTGKSTHSRLWVKNANASYINDDQPFINMDTLIVYGSPWAGKHKFYSNDCAKLNACVFLKQSQNNELVNLLPKQSISLLYKQITQYDSVEEREKMLVCMEKLIKEIPFYLLCCDKSKNAFLTSFKITGENYEN